MMEMFPDLKIGLINGWLLIAFFFGAYGITLIFFPKNAIKRLYDRSGQRNRRSLPHFFAVLLVGLWHLLVTLTPLKTGTGVFVTGMALFSPGWIGFVISLINFRNTPVDQPVRTGLYKISRHPQQLAVSLSFLGISIAIGSWTALALMVIGIMGGHKKILAEEKACLEQYGAPYKNYMERIPRYFLFF